MLIIRNRPDDSMREALPPGFDARYCGFEDYIRSITREIWEERAIWRLYDTYADDVVIHTGARTVRGLDSVITGTLKTLYAFPDRNMLGEEVTWARYGAGKDERRFFSSHRILSRATNKGATEYGGATGRCVHFRTIADCLAKDNRIGEEWLVRDNFFVVLQLGFDPMHLAREDARYRGQNPADYRDGSEDSIRLVPDKQEFPVDFILSLFDDLWRQRRYDKQGLYYRSDARVHSICDREAQGPEARQALLENLLTPFPQARIRISQITTVEDAQEVKTAVRWRLVGTHEAKSRDVNLLGINHYILRDGKIVMEWMVYDAYDLLCQIHGVRQ